jgi:4-hydroxy-3-methylbut-2-enyl diphosphate reductase
MKVILEPKFYGYCPGLKRSLNLADKVAADAKENDRKIFYDIPLAHNEVVEKTLNDQGFIKINLDDKSEGGGDYFVVSAHGASDDKIEWLRSHGFEVRSGTCPTVRRVQDQAVKDYQDGYQIVIFGKVDHAEVVGVNGCVKNSAIVVKDIEQGRKINLNKKTSVLCQTTFSNADFEKFVENLKSANPGIEIIVRNTICPVVEGRINTILKYALANKPDIVVVVGSKTSSNTKLLAGTLEEEISTIMISDDSEITADDFSRYETALVVSGTSAPPETVEKVARKLESLNS